MSSVDKFDEYRLFVEDTARLTDRRQQVTNMYIAVHSALLGLLTFLMQQARGAPWALLATLPLVAAGLAASWFWLRLLHTYRVLLDFRFQQLEAMEQEMEGLHGVYTREARRFYREAPPEQRIGFTRLEMGLPRLFLVLYGLYGLVVLAWLALFTLARLWTWLG